MTSTLPADRNIAYFSAAIFEPDTKKNQNLPS
ncbi:unnamed protein product, partial [Rotaria magnacalcarata]